jgi:apolipoprotein N-acyltransferase
LLFLPVRQIHYSAWLLVGVSSLLQVLIFPLPGLYVLSWVAFAPLIVAVLRARPAGALEIDGSVNLQAARPGQAFVLGYASGILWFAGTCYWIYDTMHEHGGLSVPAAALALFLFCLYLGLYHGLFGLLLGWVAGPGRDNRLALISVPFLWVAVELARTRVTGFPWDLLGTAQVGNISLSRITTLTGVYGVSFEIMLVNVAVAAAFLVPRKKRATLLMASLAAAAVLQAGRLVDAPAIPADRAALLVQENIPVDENWTRDTFERTLRELTELSVKANASMAAASSGAAPGAASLIVWPESPAPFFSNDPLFREPVSEMRRRLRKFSTRQRW